MLFDFLASHRDLLVGRAREKLRQRGGSPRTSHESDGVPWLLDQVASWLHVPGRPARGIEDDAHGQALLAAGFTIGQVVHDYGGTREAIFEIARELGVAFSPVERHALDTALAHAIAESVTTLSSQRERQLAAKHIEQVGFLAHELRTLLNTATLAYDVVQSGGAGVGGNTARLVANSIFSMSELVGRTLAEVRLGAAPPREERIPISQLLDEIAIAGKLAAKTRSVRISFESAPPDIDADGDAQIITSIVTNLIQNACKFTRDLGSVRLSTRVLRDRVAIDVADECGGLPPGSIDGLFRPYEQRGENRTGLGLGLAISQRGADAIGALLSARDIPGTGCVFSVALRRSVPA